MKRHVRFGTLAGLACGLLLGVPGCAFELQSDAAAHERVVDALMDELPEVVEHEFEALDLEPLGILTGRGDVSSPDTTAEDEEASTGKFSGYRDGQVYSVYGVCAGAEGVAQVRVAAAGNYEMPCTADDEGLQVLPLIEDQVLAGTELTLQVSGAPLGTAWSLGVAERP